jgi:hypothetical protein
MSRPLLKVEVGVALDLPLVETEIGHCWTYVLEFSHTMQNRSAKVEGDVPLSVEIRGAGIAG